MPHERRRSRSPLPRMHHGDSETSRRSRSPPREHHDRSIFPKSPNNVELPFAAKPLSKHDLQQYRPMFAIYLDIQKQLDIEDLPEDEVRGRWKSFIGKWNRGELARGWYDPKTLRKATEDAPVLPSDIFHQSAATKDNEDYGPALPDSSGSPSHHRIDKQNRFGPTIPSIDDIRSRREELREEEDNNRERHRKDIRQDRRIDRKQQKERLDELIPRAEAGTRDRQLEKKREKAESNRSFATMKEGGGEIEVCDSDLLGDDGLSDLKRMKREQERKKTEREIKREEILRARTAEREERLAVRREKEKKTVDMLKEIAQARFGGNNVG